MRILLVEDDKAVATSLVAVLRTGGMVVDRVDGGEEAIDFGRHYDYDAILLDLVLPDVDGFEVVRRLRAGRRSTPIIILSGLSRTEAKIKGFGLGADDFVTKPFDRDELIARIQAVVRRSKGYSEPSVTIGNLRIALDRQVVNVNDKQIHLTGKEYAIMELLVLRRGMVLTKETFLNQLYGGLDEPEMKIIDVFICKLRKKLSAAGAGNLISTVWGRGYTLADAGKAGSPVGEGQLQTAGAVAA